MGIWGVGFGSLWKFYFFKIHKVNITENRPRIPSPLPSKHLYPSEPPTPPRKKILDPRMIQPVLSIYTFQSANFLLIKTVVRPLNLPLKNQS